MLGPLDHIAIKVKDLEALARAFADIGVPTEEVVECPEVGMRILFLGKGRSKIEFLQVTSPDSPIAGEEDGPHHLGLEVEDIEESYHWMEKDPRFEPLGQICQGAKARIFFFRILEEKTLFECVEKGRG